MIVDCHTHVWETAEQLGRGIGLWMIGPPGRRSGPPLNADPRAHLQAIERSDQAIVMGFRSWHLDACVPNEYVAAYVRQYPKRLIGFAGIDPSRPVQAIDDLRRARQELGLRGATIWPAAQNVHPASTESMRVYAELCRLNMPLIVHVDTRACPACRMEFARPFLLDEVAREFPDLKMIVAGMGGPWAAETLALLAKHRQVHADVSGIVHQGWAAYNVLLSAHQAGVMDSLVFGSGFPLSNTAASIEALFSVNQFCQGTNLPVIPREQLRRILERNTPALLGLETDADLVRREPDTTVIRSED